MAYRLLPLLCFLGSVTSFVPLGTPLRKYNVLSSQSNRCTRRFSSSTTNDEELVAEIKSMRVRELKEALIAANVSIDDVFEKDELVKRLVDYRGKEKNAPADGRTKNPAADGDDNRSTNPSGMKAGTTQSTTSTISIPMDFHSLTPDKAVHSRNSNVFLRPSPGKYPSINLNIPGNARPMTLLVDTACSGLVVRPDIVDMYNLPKLNTGVTMTAAGGTMTGASVSQLNKAKLDDGTILDDLMVAGQDIGALPDKLDGIIGISFLDQFKSCNFDFKNSNLILRKKNSSDDSSMAKDNIEVLAKSHMNLSRIGVWVVDVTLDGRGPVKMLVDTGAASSFLNWEGVSSLNMDRDHALITRNTDAIGVMGADNTALALSHRFVLKRRVNLTSDPSSVGPFDPRGIDITEFGSVNIDIGNLPVLDALKSEGVGGILGSDILMMCDSLYFNQSSRPLDISMLNEIIL